MNRAAVIKRLQEAMQDHSDALKRSAIQNIQDIHLTRSGFRLIDVDNPESVMRDPDKRQTDVFLGSKRFLLGPEAEAVYDSNVDADNEPARSDLPVRYRVTVRLNPPPFKESFGFFQCMAVLGNEVTEVRDIVVTRTARTWSSDTDVRKRMDSNQSNVREMVAKEIERRKTDAEWVKAIQQGMKDWQTAAGLKATDPVGPCLAGLTFQEALGPDFGEHLDTAANRVRKSDTEVSCVEITIVRSVLREIGLALLVVDHDDEEVSVLSRIGMALWEEEESQATKNTTLSSVFFIRRGEDFRLAEMIFTSMDAGATSKAMFRLVPGLKTPIWRSTTDEPLSGTLTPGREPNKETEGSILYNDFGKAGTKPS